MRIEGCARCSDHAGGGHAIDRAVCGGVHHWPLSRALLVVKLGHLCPNGTNHCEDQFLDKKGRREGGGGLTVVDG